MPRSKPLSPEEFSLALAELRERIELDIEPNPE